MRSYLFWHFLWISRKIYIEKTIIFHLLVVIFNVVITLWKFFVATPIRPQPKIWFFHNNVRILQYYFTYVFNYFFLWKSSDLKKITLPRTNCICFWFVTQPIVSYFSLRTDLPFGQLYLLYVLVKDLRYLVSWFVFRVVARRCHTILWVGVLGSH